MSSDFVICCSKLDLITDLQSSLTRLTCPVLVLGVDNLESRGQMEVINEKLHEDKTFREEFIKTNHETSRIRKGLSNPEDIEYWQAKVGEQMVTAVLESGIAGLDEKIRSCPFY